MVPKLKVRGFEVAKGWEDRGICLPVQATTNSAGYDFFVAETTIVSPFFANTNIRPIAVPTGIRAYMRPNEVLLLFARSSLSKLGLQLANCVGVVDSDYYGNDGNDGHVQFMLWNFSYDDIVLGEGERIGQGVFTQYLSADQPGTDNKRTGGFGSTGL